MHTQGLPPLLPKAFCFLPTLIDTRFPFCFLGRVLYCTRGYGRPEKGDLASYHQVDTFQRFIKSFWDQLITTSGTCTHFFLGVMAISILKYPFITVVLLVPSFVSQYYMLICFKITVLWNSYRPFLTSAHIELNIDPFFENERCNEIWEVARRLCGLHSFIEKNQKVGVGGEMGDGGLSTWNLQDFCWKQGGLATGRTNRRAWENSCVSCGIHTHTHVCPGRISQNDDILCKFDRLFEPWKGTFSPTREKSPRSNEPWDSAKQ